MTLFAGARWALTSVEKLVAGASVRTEGTRIVEVGLDLRPRPEELVVDCTGLLLLPGLINAHNHAAENVTRGLGKALSTEQWMTDFIYPVNRSLQGDDVYWAVVLGCAEMFRNGTTAVVDLVPNFVRFHADAVVAAYRDCGMRAAVAKGAATTSLIDSAEERPPEDELAAAGDFLRRWSGHPLVTPWLGPSGFHAVDVETLGQLKALTQELGTRFNMHIAETQWQRNLALQHGYPGQVAWAEAVGLLGPDTLIAHAVWLTGDEIHTLARTGTHVVHNASSNQVLASGIAPVIDLRRAGVNVALGSDGSGSNDSTDMIAEIKAAVLLQRVAQLDASVISARDGLRMATEAAAAAMGCTGRVGRLEPGYEADLVGIQVSGNPTLLPAYDPIDLLVYSGSGRDTALTVVAGTVVYDHGRFPTLDLQRAVTAMEHLQARIEKDLIGAPA